MQGRVVFVTGPTAAGKSTVAAAWAAAQLQPTAHLDHDQARFFIRGGYISRTAAHADPALCEAADTQWLLAAAVCEAMAFTYTTNGVHVAISAFRPPGRWRGCWEQLDSLQPLIVVLFPSLDARLMRDATRSGRQHTRVTDVQRGSTYDWDAWRADQRAVVIDNSDLSVEQTVARIDEELQQRA